MQCTDGPWAMTSSDTPTGPATMETRRLTVDDCPGVISLDRAVFAEAAYSRIALVQLLEISKGAAWGCFVRGQVVAYCMGAVDCSGTAGWILSLAVDPGWRRQGIATTLLRTTLSDLAKATCADVRLTVKPDNVGARRLFEAVGFKPGIRKAEYFGPGQDRFLMVRPPTKGER